MKLTLECTCHSHPEQYDVFDDARRHVGYLRLRHGYFTVDFIPPGATFGERLQVMLAEPECALDFYGDGRFADHEREQYLAKAVDAIRAAIYERQPALDVIALGA